MKRNSHRASSDGLIYNKSFWIVSLFYFSTIIFILSILNLSALFTILILLAGLLISLILSALSVIGANYGYSFIGNFVSNPKHSNKIIKIMPKSFYVYLLEKLSAATSPYVNFIVLEQNLMKNGSINKF